MGLLAFIGNKLYDTLDFGIKSNQAELDAVKKSVEGLKTKIQEQTVEIPTRVGRAYETADKLHHRRVTDGLEQSSDKIQRLEVILREKVFPQLDKIEPISGKVIVLEQSLERLISGLKKIQKTPQQ